jgi:plasmid stabilization system protein ParE
MKTYVIQVSLTAKQDIRDLYCYIAYKLFEPQLADKYIDGIYTAIQELSIYGGSVANSQRKYLQRKYGSGVRTITYKKMTVIFNVIDDMILIRRVMASQLVL